MRATHVIWLLLALPGVVETFRLLLAARRTYRAARQLSTDPRDWDIACHDLWTERVRLAKQLLCTAGVCLSFVNLPEAWRVESRNLVFVALGLLLLLNSERDLAFRRRVRRGLWR